MKYGSSNLNILSCILHSNLEFFRSLSDLNYIHQSDELNM